MSRRFSKTKKCSFSKKLLIFPILDQQLSPFKIKIEIILSEIKFLRLTKSFLIDPKNKSQNNKSPAGETKTTKKVLLWHNVHIPTYY